MQKGDKVEFAIKNVLFNRSVKNGLLWSSVVVGMDGQVYTYLGKKQISFNLLSFREGKPYEGFFHSLQRYRGQEQIRLSFIKPSPLNKELINVE